MCIVEFADLNALVIKNSTIKILTSNSQYENLNSLSFNALVTMLIE